MRNLEALGVVLALMLLIALAPILLLPVLVGLVIMDKVFGENS